MNDVGVLVMAYGGPNTLEEVEPYLLDVRGYRETPPRVIEVVRARYERIGGRSPILEHTRAQARALEGALQALGASFVVEVGMRHWHPFIKDALESLEARGTTRVVGLVMAPHYSQLSIGKYFEQVRAAGSTVTVVPIVEWHLAPGYVRALVDRVRRALLRFPEAIRDHVAVVFTAHSLPARIRDLDDPYPDQLAATVRAVSESLGAQPYRFAYQSAGKTAEPWLGPDVGEVVEWLAASGVRDVLVAPIGFVSEHLEILYDIDVELREHAATLGVRLERIEMLGQHHEMIAELATLVRARALEAGWL